MRRWTKHNVHEVDDVCADTNPKGKLLKIDTASKEVGVRLRYFVYCTNYENMLGFLRRFLLRLNVNQ